AAVEAERELIEVGLHGADVWRAVDDEREGGTEKMTKWEYEIANFTASTIDNERFLITARNWLNDRGQDGWEAVSVTFEAQQTRVVFKRPISKESGVPPLR
ncbi:MAG: hypothetical protein ACHQ4J_14515, partial [Candidatus Binatia bacterium]